RALPVLQHRTPGGRGLVRIRRADHRQPGDRAAGSQVLYRLVRGTVLTEADRVVRPHVDRRCLHQGRQPHRGPHVVAEGEERAAVGTGEAVQGDAVDDGAHRVLADTEVHRAAVDVAGEVVRGPVRRQEGRLTGHRGVVRT